MLMTLAVVVIVSAALVGGAAWGVWGKLPARWEGFLIALAGGALIVSSMEELVRPALQSAGVALALGAVGAGAAIFTLADWLIDEKWNSSGGGGLLASITFDGVPENLALGVALIGAGPMQIAALAGSIFLSNLPEAAGGAKQMGEQGNSKKKVLLLWTGAAALLSGAAIAGHVLLSGAPEALLGAIRCLAAGAVVASLATEVFPQAYSEDRHLSGIATALGLCLAAALAQLGGGGG
ncbi:ZIP family metal transporter [Parvularcula oceani]|uniref:ZIP family metal transporter n=1 Tax=Parvularcula oceani TaxID=1247963 RepID=UPI0004E15B76|nr:zinc transporter [Parvularcula oceani]